MQDLGYIITISFGRCFGLVTPQPSQHQYDCDSNCVSGDEAWCEGRKFSLDKIQNAGADSCIIYHTPGLAALRYYYVAERILCIRMLCGTSESSTNSGCFVNCNQFYFHHKNNGILVNT